MRKGKKIPLKTHGLRLEAHPVPKDAFTKTRGIQMHSQIDPQYEIRRELQRLLVRLLTKNMV